MGRNVSYESVRSNQQFPLSFDICNKSPGVFNFNFNSPGEPTPGVNMNNLIEYKNGGDLSNPQFYSDYLASFQNRVK